MSTSLEKQYIDTTLRLSTYSAKKELLEALLSVQASEGSASDDVNTVPALCAKYLELSGNHEIQFNEAATRRLKKVIKTNGVDVSGSYSAIAPVYAFAGYGPHVLLKIEVFDTYVIGAYLNFLEDLSDITFIHNEATFESKNKELSNMAKAKGYTAASEDMDAMVSETFSRIPSEAKLKH